jgi:hypothetical protein
MGEFVGRREYAVRVAIDSRSDEELQDARAAMRPVVVELLQTLRGGGLPNPMVAVDQLSLLLLVLYAGPQLWSELVHARDRFALLRRRSFSQIFGLSAHRRAWDEALQDKVLVFPSAELLDIVVDRLDFEVTRLAPSPNGQFMCADLLDAALDEVSATSSVGSPRTPQAVSDCMIALTRLQPDDRVFDPAAGAGDRLLSVIRHHMTRHQGVGSRSDRALIRGVDLDPTMVHLGTMSLIFHGIREPPLQVGNVLADPPEEQFDVILCQPPFGNRIDPAMLAPAFRDLPKARSEILFAELTLALMTPHARAAIVLPMSVTFSTGAAAGGLRRRLLERLRAVVTLPQGTFQPHTNVETVIVVLGRTAEHVVFIDGRDDEHSDMSQSALLLQRSGAIVADLLDRDLALDELPIELRDRVLMVSTQEIADSGYSLQFSRYQSHSTATDLLDDPRVLFGQIMQLETEIGTHLEELGRDLAERRAADG